MSLHEQLQHSLGSAYTLKRELGGGGMSRCHSVGVACVARAADSRAQLGAGRRGAKRIPRSRESKAQFGPGIPAFAE